MDVAAIICVMIGVPLFDWLAVMRLAAFYPEFDYRYWPLTKARIATILAMMLAFFLVIVFADADNPSWIILVGSCIAIAAWGIVALRDVNAQRATGYRKPLIYGERDYRD